MLDRPLFSPIDKRADRSRRGIKNVHLIFIDDLPETIRLRIIRRAFIHESGRSICERPVNDIAVAGNPADIRCAPIGVVIFEVENPLGRDVNAGQVSAGGMNDTFRFTGRAAGVKNE